MLKQVEFTKEDLWAVMRAFIEEEGLVQHHIKSYNHFVKEGLKELIKSLGDLEVRTKYGTITLKMRDPEIGKPSVVEIDGTVLENVKPMECRLRNLTYAAPLYVTMSLFVDGKPVTRPEKVEVGIIP